MARRKIREYDAKRILCRYFTQLDSQVCAVPFQSFLVSPETNHGEKKNHEITFSDHTSLDHTFSNPSSLVVKPDMLFGKRKQYGLVLLKATAEEVLAWIEEHRNKPFTISKATGTLTHFLIEPYVLHDKEYYVAFTSERDGEMLQFSSFGGANIEERWETVRSLFIPTGETPSVQQLSALIDNAVEKKEVHEAEKELKKVKKEVLVHFLQALHRAFVDLSFTSLEINPFVIDNQNNQDNKDNKDHQQQIHLLDLVAEVDDCASFKNLWPELIFPPAFGRNISAEEKFITKLDEESGASLKLTVLNRQGRVWNILSGGGASIISLDSLTNAGLGGNIANYGEYSGNPTPEESYQYAKTVLEAMMQENKNPSSNFQTPSSKPGKVLLIAGAIANFTDVEKTFSGIVRALEEYQKPLCEAEAKIIVRRGGPNYEKGLLLIQEAGKKLGLPLEVYGPEMPLAEVAMKVVEKLKE